MSYQSLQSKKIKTVVTALAAIGVAAAAYFGRVVPFSEQWPLFEALRTTAAIIFGVVGAWFAIIYPERFRLSFGQEKAATGTVSANGMNRLFTPIVHSTCILSVILVAGLLAPVLKRLDILFEYRATFRGLSFSLLTALTFWQMITILYSLAGPDMLKSDADAERHSKSFADRFTNQQKH